MPSKLAERLRVGQATKKTADAPALDSILPNGAEVAEVRDRQPGPHRPLPADVDAIRVRGARVHNLKNISFDVPHNQITIVTGVSGSGKSSLAFDTVYAEGQRRYIESLSAYARQFLERIEKPDVDEITGIAPAIAIRQKNSTRNPRSTVATATEIYDYLRLLYARAGHTFCIVCGEEVRKDTIDEIANRVLQMDPGRRFYVLYLLKLGDQTASASAVGAQAGQTANRALSPTGASAAAATKSLAGGILGRLRGRKPARPSAEAIKLALTDLQKRGFNRLYQDGQVYEFSSPESLLDVDFAHPVYVVVDRLSLDPSIRSRLMDSVEICYREGGGEAILQFVGGPANEPTDRLVFNERFECKKCGIVYQEPEPRLFSFNNPYGACPRCQGFGNTIDFSIDKVIPDRGKSLAQGAIVPWTKPRYRQHAVELKRYARAKNIPMDVPFRDLPQAQQDKIIEGDRSEDYEGINGFFAWLERKKYKLHVRVFLSHYRGYATCPDCNGTRLRAEARAVRVAGKSLTEVVKMTVTQARKFFDSLELSPVEMQIAEKVVQEVQERLKFLDEVGLDYVTLDRLTSTLSGGESQRIQLATSLGSHLVGSLYVLDEPSIGLHPRDTHRLIQILKNLRDLGNTLVVVEHDVDTILAADYALDLGPGAGEIGGKVIFEGSLDALLRDTHSLTARYINGDLRIPVPTTRRKPHGKFIKIIGARSHNLKNIDVMIPLNMITVVTGVSGSGKSTLVHDVLYRGINAKRAFENYKELCEAIEGDHHINAMEMVDQSPIGRTPRSNPATYTKAFDPIREVFASTTEAKRRGFTAGHFSFNVPGGRCEACEGEGIVTVEMRFLADVELICEECQGTRYKSSVREVLYHGKSIPEVLQMTVREALGFFAAVPKITSKLKILDEVGLGYLRLGQSATTLSGGEAQRLKLAAHLSNKASAGVLYIFDEPSTGLHFDDIQKLLASFRKLVEGGASVLIIEHNLDIIKSADWIIDLGPEGGEGGGRVIAAGTPEQVARNSQSFTGHFLAPVLARAQQNSNGGHAERNSHRPSNPAADKSDKIEPSAPQ
jgi:excinuclease ABC subunit A